MNFKCFLAFFISFGLLSACPKDLLSFQDVDKFSGSDQRFTTEYSHEVFAETFHQNEILSEKPIIDEVQSQPLDAWRYYRAFSSGVLHDSNFSATPRDPKPETIYSYAPTVGMSHRTQHTFIKMFYSLSYADYVQNDKSSRFSNVQTTDLWYNFNRLKINIKNVFQPDTAFVQGERTELHTTDGKHVITYANNAQLVVDYKYSPKTNLSYTYTNGLLFFPKTTNVSTDNASQSSMTHAFSPKISYKLTPKTSIFMDHRFVLVDYFKGGSFSSHENGVDIGIQGKIFSEVGISLSAGYSYVEYLKSVSPSASGFNYALGLSKRILPKVRSTLSAGRGISQDFDSELFESTELIKDFYGVNITWNATPHIAVDVEGSIGYTSRDGAITLPDMDNPTNLFTRPREDEIYKWGTKALWTPRPFFNFTLAYEFINKNSSFKDFEYYAHRVAGSFTYKF